VFFCGCLLFGIFGHSRGDHRRLSADRRAESTCGFDCATNCHFVVADRLELAPGDRRQKNSDRILVARADGAVTLDRAEHAEVILQFPELAANADQAIATLLPVGVPEGALDVGDHDGDKPPVDLIIALRNDRVDQSVLENLTKAVAGGVAENDSVLVKHFTLSVNGLVVSAGALDVSAQQNFSLTLDADDACHVVLPDFASTKYRLN
jgi:hypothetical protein